MLGVVSAFHPAWVADTMRWMVALIATPVLIWAANTSMLGVSRHIYTLAINRQIPSWLGKLRPAHGDALRGDRDQRPDRARPRRSRPTSSCWPGSTPSARPWRSRSPTSRSSACGSSEPDRRRPVPDPDGRPLARRRAAAAGDLRRAAQRPRLRQRPRLPRRPPAGSAAAGWPSGSSSTSSTARSSRGRR